MMIIIIMVSVVEVVRGERKKMWRLDGALEKNLGGR
jgi:hypothetical protein